MHSLLALGRLFVGSLVIAAMQAAWAQPAAGESAVASAETSGPVRLRQPPQAAPQASRSPAAAPAAYVPGEFERFVGRLVGAESAPRRLGAELLTPPEDEVAAIDDGGLVPGDYVVVPGDEVLVAIWGSVDADLRLTVDRAGRIHVPRVGSIQVGGVRADALRDIVARRVGQVFRNFELSASLGQLRGIRVFVTGNVVRPGNYTIASLGRITSALVKAGGPSAAGTFRGIELRRASAAVGTLDLYDLLLKGDRSADLLLQHGDVVHVGGVGTQVAIIGSVNRPAVIELKPGQTASDAINYAGGFSAVADRSRLSLERLENRFHARIVQLPWPASAGKALEAGDVLRVFSTVDSVLATQPQSKRVRVEGEVLRPGEYVLPARSSVGDALAAAGGFTPAAFVFATEFTRESVRQNQQQNYDRALRDLETDLARAGSTQRITSGDEALARQAVSATQTRLLEKLRSLQPSGRIILQLEPETRELPDLALEDGDRIYIPQRPTTVGIFGSVFNTGNYLHSTGRELGDYLRLAGGATRGADTGSTFVVRANGSVVSARQRRTGWLSSGAESLASIRAEPGDTIFVPEEMDKATWLQITKDWTQVLYQFGLGIAGIAAATR